MRFLLVLLLWPSLLFNATQSWSQTAKIQVQQPDRGYGYLLGDVMLQKIVFSKTSQINTLKELPAIERVGPWLYRMGATIDSKNNTLLVSYQIINSPEERIIIRIPELELQLSNSEIQSVKSWPISIGPLSPDALSDEGDLITMQPDTAPAISDPAKARGILILCVALLVLLTMLWLAWWMTRNLMENRKLPYAQAYQNLKRMDNETLADDPAAWQLLHRAFNQSAQRAIHEGALQPLFLKAPWLKPFKNRIESFYSASSQRFFQQTTPAENYPLLQLSKELYLTEKQETTGRPVFNLRQQG